MRRALTALTLLALLVAAPAALARDRSDDLLRDACFDEHVSGTYSQQDYRRALDKLPTDTDEYTGCRDVLKRAQLAAASGRRGSGSSGGPSVGGGTAGPTGAPAPNRDPLHDATPQERKAVERASEAGATPVRIGDGLVRPGLASAADLPTPLLVVLALLAAGGLGAGAWILYARVLARRLG